MSSSKHSLFIMSFDENLHLNEQGNLVLCEKRHALARDTDKNNLVFSHTATNRNTVQMNIKKELRIQQQKKEVKDEIRTIQLNFFVFFFFVCKFTNTVTKY